MRCRRWTSSLREGWGPCGVHNSALCAKNVHIPIILVYPDRVACVMSSIVATTRTHTHPCNMTEMLSVFNVACARIISRTRVCSVVVAYQCWPAPMLRENTSLQTQPRDACDSLTTSACMPRETFGGVSGWSSPHTGDVCSCFCRGTANSTTHTHASASCSLRLCETPSVCVVYKCTGDLWMRSLQLQTKPSVTCLARK